MTTSIGIVPKSFRLDSIPKGSISVTATVRGTDIHALLSAALEATTAFRDEHDGDPVPERTRFTGFTTSFETVFELIEEPDYKCEVKD